MIPRSEETLRSRRYFIRIFKAVTKKADAAMTAIEAATSNDKDIEDVLQNSSNSINSIPKVWECLKTYFRGTVTN